MNFENYTLTKAAQRIHYIPTEGSIKISNPKHQKEFWIIIYQPSDEDDFINVLKITFESKTEMSYYLSGFSDL